MRILIVGGTRFIGPPVASRLAGAGHEVAVLHRGESEAELPPAVTHFHADRHRLDVGANDLRRFAPEVVIDTAAYTERDARAVVDAVRGVARRLVVLSSQDVYRAYGRFHRTEPGPPERVPYDEDAPLREQLYPYRGQGRGLDDYEKIAVERAATTALDLPATVLRLPMVYGAGDYQRRLFIELRRMDDLRPAILLEETFSLWRWSRAYVENVAAAIALAATDERATGRVYNVGEAEARTYLEWLKTVGLAAGWHGEITIVPDGRLPNALRPPDGDYTQHMVADTSRIRNELGYIEPVPFFQGMLRSVQWERSQRERHPPAPADYVLEDGVLKELASEAAAASETPPAAL